MTYVLAGDIGGTRARFAVYEVNEGLHLVHEHALDSRAYRTFRGALAEFLEVSLPQAFGRSVAVEAATFGIAGPVVRQRVKTTNLPWTVDGASLSRAFSIPKVTLLNDLVAVGLGATSAPPSKLAVVHKGRPKRTGGNLAVIAAGTGLGEAAFVWDGEEHVPCATEGGHADFGPRNGLEDELLAMLREEHGRVSYERVVAGSSISTIYRFFVREQRIKESKRAAAHVEGAEDPNVAIVDLAESGQSEAAMRTIELWSSVYGAEAGNLALKTLATAGVYLCGGVSARLAPILARGLPARRKRPAAESPFVAAFLDKGRMRSLVEAIPVAVCVEPRAGIIGAATHAAKAAAAARKATRRRGGAAGRA